MPLEIFIYFHGMPTDQHIIQLLQCIALEEKEQVKRFSLDQQHTLKSLKAEGLALHPITITRKKFWLCRLSRN